MNKIKLQLYRNCPRIIRRSIQKMLTEYDDLRNYSRLRDKEDKEAKETTLERILPEVLTDSFFDFIYNRCNFRFKLGIYYPPVLIDNQEFVDLVIKYDPSNVLFIPNHQLLRTEHVKMFEDYLVKNPGFSLGTLNIPEILSNSEIVFERKLTSAFEDYFRGDYELYDLLNFYKDKPNFYRKIIEKHKAGNFPVDSSCSYIDSSFLFEDEIIEYVIKRNYELISYVPDIKLDFALHCIADLIKEGNCSLPIYSYSSWFNIIRSSKIIIDAIFSLDDISKYISFINGTSVSLYDEEQALKLLEYNERNNTFVVPRNVNQSSMFFLNFLKFNDKKIFNKFDFFDESAYDDKVINYLLEHLSEFPAYIASIIVEKNHNNGKNMKALLSKYKNELLNAEAEDNDFENEHLSCEKIFKEIVKIEDSFFESYLDIISLLARKGELKFKSFSKNLWSDEKFVSALEERGLLDILVDDVYESMQKDNVYVYQLQVYNSQFIKKYIDKCTNDVNNGNVNIKSLKYIGCYESRRLVNPEIMDSMINYINALIENDLLSRANIPDLFFELPDVLEFYLKKARYRNLLCRFKYGAFESPEVINLLFRKCGFIEFNENIIRVDRLNYAFEKITITDVEEFNMFFDELNKHYNMSLAMLLVVKYKESGLNDANLNQISEYYITKVQEELGKRYGSVNYAEVFIDKVLNGARNPFTLSFIKNTETLCVAAYYCDILKLTDEQQISEDLLYLYQNVNKKHVNDIIKLLSRFNEITEVQRFTLALKMYVSIGYNRSKDLLNTDVNKNYGNVFIDSLNTLFDGIDLSSIVLERQGKGFVIGENKVLINLLFGANYRDKSTPICHYFDGFLKKRSQVDKKILEINNRNDLTNEEKNTIVNELNDSFNDYRNQVTAFVNNFSSLFNQWDIVEEEFLKKQNKSKLDLKLNIAVANSILKAIDARKNMPALELRDDPLVNTDVFEYVGRDTQYTTNPAQAPGRAVELSRRMDSVTSKKFPNIKIEQNGYTLFVYGPQDRRILSGGFRSGCCFRPNGVADNRGENNSLLNYCVSTEYGGGIEIRDKDGDTVMFSPLLRNGNVLMIHSIETLVGDNVIHMQNVHEMLVEFAKKCIEESYKCGDAIDFVVVTNLHNLDNKYHKGALPNHKKFVVYDAREQFLGMYTNLDNQHMILANREGKTVEDILYGSVDYSYDYPGIKSEYYFHVQIGDEEKSIIAQLENINKAIITKANERFGAKEKKDLELSNALLHEIKNLRKSYLVLYKELLDRKQGIDLYTQYKRARETVKVINEKLGIKGNFEFEEVVLGLDWYIAITSDKKVIAHCLPTAKHLLKRRLEELKEMRPNLTEQLSASEVTNGFRI